MRLGAVAVVVCVLAAGCGGDSNADDDPAPPTPAPPSPAETGVHAENGRGGPGVGAGGDVHERAASPPAQPAPNADERAVAAAVRDYVAAVDARDGKAVCALLAPRAIEAVQLPRERGGCAPSLSASIGYRDPRGVPVFEGATVAAVGLVEVEGGDAKAVATVVTEFADRPEPSIEDDVVYLQRQDDRWLIAKPSSTLYRAVGIADVPPSVLAPPR